MNIQFMTDEANGIPTGKIDWNGDAEYRYIPNFDEMKKNASCEEEIEAIEKVQEMIDSGFFNGFAYEIVYTDLIDAIRQDGNGKIQVVKEWQMLQHPWYRHYEGRKRVFDSKEKMIADIEANYLGKA